MKHIGTVRIETERLTLRPFAESDAQAMYDNWASDPVVTEYLTWPVHASVDASLSIIRMWAEECKSPAVYQWCVAEKETDEAVGSLSIVRIDEENDEMEVGYCLSRRCWGKGYMPEAVRAVIDVLFRETGVRRITAKHDTENLKSGRVMQKAGMTLVEAGKKMAENNLGLRPMTVYAIARPEG